jgi:hypothetical protein
MSRSLIAESPAHRRLAAVLRTDLAAQEPASRNVAVDVEPAFSLIGKSTDFVEAMGSPGNLKARYEFDRAIDVTRFSGVCVLNVEA